MRAVLLYLTCLFFTSLHVTGQDITDTLFYDARWSICERPAATYYRIGTMRIDSLARYIGPAQDFYMNGTPEMKATYSAVGDLHGEITFYFPNGKVKIHGWFSNGTMTGKWSYFNEDGTLRAAFNCADERTFTPLFLRNKRGKVLLENGNGKFRIRTSDYSDIIYPADFSWEGEVRNGLKEGTWKYTALFTVFGPQRSTQFRKTVVSENYVHDKFMRALGNPEDNVRERKVLNRPFQYFTLYPEKFEALERLHADFIFARTRDGRYQLRSFLLARRPPVIEEAPVSPDQNFALLIRVLGNAMTKKEELRYYRHRPPGRSFSGFSYELLQLYATPKNIPRYDAKIKFTIMPNRSIGNIEIIGKIDEQLKGIITYYLSRIRNLHYTGNPLDDDIVLNLKTSFQSTNALYRGSIVLNRL